MKLRVFMEKMVLSSRCTHGVSESRGHKVVGSEAPITGGVQAAVGGSSLGEVIHHRSQDGIPNSFPVPL